MTRVSRQWLAAAICAFTLTACGGSGGRRGSSSDGGDNAAGAAQSLANALEFQNEGAANIDGRLPEASPDAPELASDSGDVEGTIAPGGMGTISVRVAEEDPDDPVVATLVWFDGADTFASLPVAGATVGDDGAAINTFTVSQDVCNDLCNIVHQVKCYEAAQTSSGLVTAANLRTVMLECTGSGDPAKCGNTTPQPDTSSPDTSGPDIDHGTTWEDPDSGLTWQTPPTEDASGRRVSQQEAGAYCEGLDLDGTGWRLPTIEELQTVIKDCEESTECDLQACASDEETNLFDQAPCCSCSYGSGPTGSPETGFGCYWPAAFGTRCRMNFWSSTPAGDDYKGEPGYWTVEFGRASPEARLADGDYETFCVR